MIQRCLFVCTVVAAMLVLPQAASAAGGRTAALATARSQAAYREAIRQTPLLMRPNRPGHFYGNTVRRMHARRMGNGF